MINKTIKWGIIGCGNVTEVKSGPAFNKVDGSQLVAVMRRDAKKAKDYAQRHKVARWYSDAQELINDEDVNAVYVATPPDSHAEYAIAAMKAGKAVYVEKPMATMPEECSEMLRVSKATGMPLFVAYYRRTLPGFLKVKSLLEEGAIGQALFVNIRLSRPANDEEKQGTAWRIQPAISGGGIFHDLASHQFDYLDFIFGEIIEAQGRAVNNAGFYTADDTVVATWQHQSGVLGSGSWCFVTNQDGREDYMEIVGSQGRLVFSSFGHTPLHLFKDGKEQEISYEVPENIQYYLIKQVVEDLQGKGTCVSTGESAWRTNAILEKIAGSH